MTTASERQALDMEIAGLKQELAKQKADDEQEITKTKKRMISLPPDYCFTSDKFEHLTV